MPGFQGKAGSLLPDFPSPELAGLRWRLPRRVSSLSPAIGAGGGSLSRAPAAVLRPCLGQGLQPHLGSRSRTGVLSSTRAWLLAVGC